MSALQPTDRLRPMLAADLDRVRAWRNHPDVRRHMFATHEIGVAEHAAWFARAAADPGRRLLIFEADGDATGFVNLCCVVPPSVWDWGFYVAPGSHRGSGKRLAKAVFQLLFREASAHKLCAQVLASNLRSLKFHQGLGFTREGTLREQHFDGSGYQDVVCFGLLRREYAEASD